MKNLELTEKTVARIRKSAGEDIDLNNLAVYETIVLNTLPLSKRDTIFDKGVHTRSTLVAMATYVNEYTGGVPLQVMHERYNLPVGKLFYAEVREAPQGHDEIRGLFYVLKDSESQIKTKLDTGIIDEVSVGISHKHIFCSECDFDYLSEESSYENLWTATCENDHIIGENGCHARLVGVDIFHELSLVTRGAANKAKIIGPSQALLNQDYFKQLAASGRNPQEQILFTIKTTKEKDVAKDDQASGLDLNAFVGELSDLKAAKVTFEAEIKTLKADIVSKDEVITGLQASVAELNAEKDTDKVTALANLELADKFIRDIASRSLIATGEGVDKLPDELAEVIKLTEGAQAKLSAAIPVGGASMDAQAADDKLGSKQTASFKAFKSNNRKG